MSGPDAPARRFDLAARSLRGPLGSRIRRVLDAALDAVEPSAALRRALARSNLSAAAATKVWLVAVGKAAVPMAAAAVAEVGGNICGGIVVSKQPAAAAAARLRHLTAALGARDVDTLEVLQGAHPVPDARSARAAARVRDVVTQATSNEVVLVALSGGASSLLAMPHRGLTIADLAQTTEALLAAGVPIEDLNAVRKHLEVLKGGGLAQLAVPARVLTFVLCDVVGASLDAVGSGMTMGDATTFAQAQWTLQAAGHDVPASVRAFVAAGVAGQHPETPTADEVTSLAAAPVVIADNTVAVAAAAQRARAEGFFVDVGSPLRGEARDAGVALADALRQRVARRGASAQGSDAPQRGAQADANDSPSAAVTATPPPAAATATPPPAALLVPAAPPTSSVPPAAAPWMLVRGGETTVTLRGDGRGGRNQELAVAALVRAASAGHLHDGAGSDSGSRAGRWCIVTLATDGEDGPTDAAGAAVSAATLAAAHECGLDPRDFLARNDAYSFLDAVGELLRPGPTGTNVCDLALAVHDPRYDPADPADR